MTRENKQVYLTPAMEVVRIEMQQAMLAGSNQGQVEELGNIKEEIGWSNSRRGDDWGNLWD